MCLTLEHNFGGKFENLKILHLGVQILHPT